MPIALEHVVGSRDNETLTSLVDRPQQMIGEADLVVGAGVEFLIDRYECLDS